MSASLREKAVKVNRELESKMTNIRHFVPELCHSLYILTLCPSRAGLDIRMSTVPLGTPVDHPGSPKTFYTAPVPILTHNNKQTTICNLRKLFYVVELDQMLNI